MITHALIEEAKNRLIKAYKPCEIYIFGSYAWGEPDDESDLDLLIVVDKYKKANLHSLLANGHRVLIGLRFSKDIVIYSKNEFEEFSKDRTKFCYKVKHHGRKIYEAHA